MSNVPGDLNFARSHEWVRTLSDGTLEMGISDHAQHALGDLVFVELPEVGRTLAAGEACAVVESVKAASDVYAPLGGTVAAVNEQLRNAPQLINSDPYGAGWLLRIRPDAAAPPAALLTPAQYSELIAAEG